MPIISYAQNFEDVILNRALKSVDKGFYVDVGAMDPVVDSVTKTFYDMGWHGINIEPLEQNFQKFLKDRPLDINLNCLAGDNSGEAVFYELVNTGLSTQDKDQAKELSRKNGYDLLEQTMSVDTLTNILNKVNPPIIHFLKIDVEGAEEAVLNGTDLKRFRPWIIVVESTIPGSPIQKYSSWEPYLLSHSYDFAYFDGLNRFYVAHEKEDLIQEVNLPPNVFDQFITFRELTNSRLGEENSNLRLKIDSLIEKLEHASENIRQINLKLAESESKFKETKLLNIKITEEKRVLESSLQESISNKQALLDELMSLYSSKSFRVTRPLRSFARWMHKAAGKIFGVDDPKTKQPKVQDSSGQFREDLAGSELAEDTEYFYSVLKDLMGKNK